MSQTELVKELQLKINGHQDEFDALHKRINEFRAFAGLGLASLSRLDQPSEEK